MILLQLCRLQKAAKSIAMAVDDLLKVVYSLDIPGVRLKAEIITGGIRWIVITSQRMINKNYSIG